MRHSSRRPIIPYLNNYVSQHTPLAGATGGTIGKHRNGRAKGKDDSDENTSDNSRGKPTFEFPVWSRERINDEVKIRRWRVEDGTEVDAGGTAPVIAASRDGRRLGAGVGTWGTTKCARGQLWPLRPQNVCAVDVSPDGMRITTDRTARLPASGRSRLASDCSARCNTWWPLQHFRRTEFHCNFQKRDPICITMAAISESLSNS